MVDAWDAGAPWGGTPWAPAMQGLQGAPDVVRQWFMQNWKAPVGGPQQLPGGQGGTPWWQGPRPVRPPVTSPGLVAGPTLSGRQPLPVGSPTTPGGGGGLTQGTLDRMLAMTAAANARGASGPGGWGSARPDVVGAAAPVSAMTGSGFDASGSLLRRSGPAPLGPPQSLIDKINAALAAAGSSEVDDPWLS